MQCRNCGTEIAAKAIVCYRCGTATAEPRIPPPAARPTNRRSIVPWAALAALAAGIAASTAYCQGLI